MLGKIECRRKRGNQRMRWLNSTTTDAMNMNLRKLWELLRDREAVMLSLSSPKKPKGLPKNALEMQAFVKSSSLQKREKLI